MKIYIAGPMTGYKNFNRETFILMAGELDTETNRVVIEDVKGKKTAVYNIKKKLFEKRYKPQTIKEIKE